MKTILFDFISLQDSYINGGFEYTFKILTTLLNQNVKILALCEENKPFMPKVQNLLDEKLIQKIYLKEIQQENFEEKYNISLFFVGVAQRYNKIDLSNVKCPIYMVCHDINDIIWRYGKKLSTKEFKHFAANNNDSDSFFTKMYKKLRYSVGQFYYTNFAFSFYKNFAELIKKQNVHLITVSNFSKHAIEYNFNSIANEILVFYPPKKEIYTKKDESTSENINEIISSKKKKYFLLVSCNRIDKNACLFAKMWNRFCEKTQNEFFAVCLGKIHIKMKNLLCLPYVKDAELELLYKNAYAFVYPSIAEGFGYPPIEAMKYDIPCICSNVTSIPEICSHGVLYFSPFYPEDLYKSMMEITENYETWQEKAKNQYKIVSQKQEDDLNALINILCK